MSNITLKICYLLVAFNFIINDVYTQSSIKNILTLNSYSLISEFGIPDNEIISKKRIASLLMHSNCVEKTSCRCEDISIKISFLNSISSCDFLSLNMLKEFENDLGEKWEIQYCFSNYGMWNDEFILSTQDFKGRIFQEKYKILSLNKEYFIYISEYDSSKYDFPRVQGCSVYINSHIEKGTSIIEKNPQILIDLLIKYYYSLGIVCEVVE